MNVPSKTSQLKRWQLPIGIAISFVFLWIALRGIHFDDVWLSLRGADYGWLLPVFLAYFVTVGLRAWRWQVLIKPIKTVPWWHLCGIVALGYLGNSIYPFRIGELLRVFLLNQWEEVPVSGGLATLLVERVFDGISVLVLVFGALLLVPLPVPEMQNLVMMTSVLFFGLLVIFLGMAFLPKQALVLVNVVAGWLPGKVGKPLIAVAGSFLAGLAALRSPLSVLILLISSVLIWVFEAAKFWFVMQAFPFDVGMVVVALTLGITNLASILPSAPGFVGTFDLPMIAMLKLYGVQDGLATAYTLVLHTTLWLSATVFGLVYMLYAGVRWADLGRAGQVK
ncbi:MAG: flippase-like domain-containing protein [Anaerolineae bacterium]|nr:flippase-like domain-containing protein [Anaerolineae bacterium]